MAQKTSLYDIEGQKYVNGLADELKKIKEFEMPLWAHFVKTSAAKERPPVDNEWWYKRAASILRQIHNRGVVGVSRLRTRYGSNKERGMKPKHFFKASGKIIRLILQQAEKAGLLEKSKGKKVGRKLTKKGKELLDNFASSLKPKKPEGF